MNNSHPNPWWKQPWFLALLLTAATFLAYQPAWHGAPVFDDDDHLTPPELSTVAGLAKIWTELGAVSQYYPVTHSAFWLQHQLWGDAMLGYHLVNILLHVGAALLLMHVLRRLGIPGGWLAAAIFALHPVHAESVAWISELKNTLSTVFYLGAALAYLRFDETRQRAYHLIALGLFVAGLLSKSVTATLPAALLVVFWWKRGSLSWTRDIRPIVPFFVLGVGAGIFTAWMERTYIGAQGDAFALSGLERVLLAGRVVWFYLGKLLWPAELMFIYPRWDVSAASLGQWVFPVLAVAALITAWTLRRRTRGPLAMLLLFGGTLVPVLGFLNVYPFVYSYVADHYQYLASLAVVTAAAAWIALALTRHQVWGRPAGNIACFALLALLGGLTWRQSRMYAGPETLWLTTIEKNSACWVGHANLGNFYLEQGRVDDAIRHSEAALALRPRNAEAHNNLGNALRQKGDSDRALAHYRQAVSIRPDLAAAHYNIGVVLLQRGELGPARASFEKAVELEPEFVKARNNLGSILLEFGEADQAMVHIERALAIRPDDIDAANNLGNAWLRKGDRVRAIAQYERALTLDPANAIARINLGTCLQQEGRLAEAANQLREALMQMPDSPQLHATLGNVFAEQQRFDQAIAHFEKSLALRPDHAPTHNDLGDALLQTGQTEKSFSHFLRAVELAPEHAPAQFNVGIVLLQNGRADEAVERFSAAIAAQPEFPAAYYQLGSARLQKGQLVEATDALRKAVGQQPAFPAAWNDLGIALVQQGQADEAVRCFRAAIEAQPNFAEAHNNLGRVFAPTQPAEAVKHFQAALQAQKDNPETLVNLAWVFATARDAAVRNGMQAIFLAQRANQLAGAPHPFVLRTLAAAYAESGRFEEAVLAIEKAIALALEHGDAALADEFRQQLAHYREGAPLRDPPEVVVGAVPR